MSRSSLKPISVSRLYGRQLRKIATRFVASRRQCVKRLNLIGGRLGRVSHRSIRVFFGGSRLIGKIRKGFALLTPKKLDSVVSLSTRSYAWQNFAYGIIKKSRRRRAKKLKRVYNPSRYMLLTKFGEFIKTRVFYGFRRRKDKKKIQKLRKDIKKAEKQKLHQRRENARLMRKAIMETRAANRKKAGARPIKKKK